MRNLGLAAFFCLFGATLFGQSYPEDRGKFVKEFQRILSSYISGEQKDFIRELEKTLVETTEFPEDYFKQMVATCNTMELKRLKPYPEVYNYVFSVHSFVKTKQPNTSFIAWHNSVDKLLDARNIKKFEDFIELSAGFFSEFRISSSSNFDWYYYGPYVFEFTDKPLIRFTDGRLVCGVPNTEQNRDNPGRFIDSLVILNTSGVYDPILRKWEGNGGRITWEKVGLSPMETYAEIGKVEVNMKSSTVNLDSVMLTTPYFTRPIPGQLSDRAFRHNRASDAIFPQFLSYEKKLSIKEIRIDMDYEGGFSMQGASFVGIGTAKEPAQLIIRRNGKTFIKAESQMVTIAPGKINSTATAFSLYFAEGDSLHHPGLDFQYIESDDEVQFIRGKSGVSLAPFSDSYHKLDIYTAEISWNRKKNELYLNPGQVSQEQKIARLESKDFYDPRLYDRLQGLEQIHPLVAISRYCYKNDEYIVEEGKIATAMSKTIEQARPVILELAGLGFLSYDSERRLVTINPKLDNFIQSRAGKKDYDNLQFVSDLRPRKLEGYTEDQIKESKTLQQIQKRDSILTIERRKMKNFGVISLSTMEIKLEAVDRVNLSEAQAAFVLPDSARVTVKKNRDFEFKGWSSVGKMETYSFASNYTYESNKINMLKTGRSIFRVRPLAQADGTTSIAMISSITGLIGEIQIDDPNNRSGNDKNITSFPKLKSTKVSKVYYNSRDIYRGAYDSSRFFFAIEPFELDSLDNFKEKSFRLKGELTSAGIFPVFKEELRIMPDYSFGFTSKAPDAGYDFYGTKAKYGTKQTGDESKQYNKIVLSANGLQGAGKIDFIHSTSISPAFTFLPDSTIGYAEFVNRPVETGVEFPDVSSKDAFITYVPRSNILRAASTQTEDLAFFKGEVQLKGTAVIQENGMTGYGIMVMEKANLGSDNFRYKRWEADADTANFNLKNTYPESADEDPLAFKTDNVTAHMSFKERKGEFKSNAGESIVTFPVNQYVCKMDLFTWLMDNDAVELESKQEEDMTIESDLDLVGPNFFSIHPDQDSLQFKAPKATFALKEKVINCSKTEFIDVADARIYPDSAKVVIRKRAKMDPLVNSRIVANYITKYHTFTQANTEISARRFFKATGKYPYYDADSNKTMLTMDMISVDSTDQTFARGSVASDANFKLSAHFDYYGKINIKAANPLLYFDGATRINHNCAKFERNWMSFSAQIEPLNIQIPVSSAMKSLEGDPISAGIVWRDSRARDSVSMYPTFLSALQSPTDPIVITASGLLQYDFAAKEYQIGSREKLNNRAEKGNFLALHTESCSLNGEGKIDLGMDYGDISVDAVGTVNYDQTTGKTSMNTTLRFNLPMATGAFGDVAQRINETEGVNPVDIAQTTLEQALLEWGTRKVADDFKGEYVSDGKVKRVPDELEKSIVLTGVRLESHTKASDEDRGLVTSLDGAAIVNLYGKMVMKQVIYKAFFEQLHSSIKDRFVMLIQVPGGSDYLFNYAVAGKNDGVLSIYTTDGALSGVLTEMKEDKRKARNFKYEITTNQVYLAKLMRLFE